MLLAQFEVGRVGPMMMVVMMVMVMFDVHLVLLEILLLLLGGANLQAGRHISVKGLEPLALCTAQLPYHHTGGEQQNTLLPSQTDCELVRSVIIKCSDFHHFEKPVERQRIVGKLLQNGSICLGLPLLN